MHGWTLSRCFFQINVQYADFVHECVLCTPADNESASLKNTRCCSRHPGTGLWIENVVFDPLNIFAHGPKGGAPTARVVRPRRPQISNSARGV